MRVIVQLALVVCLLTSGQTPVRAQSQVTYDLQKEYDSRSFFLYHNTVWMLNQSEDPEFDALIANLERMKLLLIKKTDTFTYNPIRERYEKAGFESIMTSRYEGNNFDMFIKEKDGKTKGMLVLVNSDDSFIVLDMVGTIPLDKVTKLYSIMNDSDDLGGLMNRFIKGDKKEVEGDSIKVEVQ